MTTDRNALVAREEVASVTWTAHDGTQYERRLIDGELRDIQL